MHILCHYYKLIIVLLLFNSHKLALLPCCFLAASIPSAFTTLESPGNNSAPELSDITTIVTNQHHPRRLQDTSSSSPFDSFELEYDLIRKGTAFCQPHPGYAVNPRNFPTEQPERQLPWVWEAVYDPVQSYVEVISVSRAACQFNHTTWKYLASKFPELGNHLSFGIDSNILVPVDEEIKQNPYPFNLINQVYICRFFDKFHQPLFTTESYPVRGHRYWSTLSTFHIRCPVPSEYQDTHRVWSHMQLEQTSKHRNFLDNALVHRTGDFPMCKLPRYRQSHDSKLFDLSICTASSRSNRAHLVEWIEYHRLVGVQHFFIYDTAIASGTGTRKEATISQTLQDYIAEGLVTVVPWHFQNCARHGMASGRWFGWMEAAANESGNKRASHFPDKHL